MAGTTKPRRKTMRRSAKDFRRDAAKHDPYELELSDGTVATVKPSKDMSIADQIALGQWTPMSEGASPLEIQLRHMLGEHYDAFWGEWKNEPRYVVDAFVKDVDDHFGDEVDEGKAPS